MQSLEMLIGVAVFLTKKLGQPGGYRKLSFEGLRHFVWSELVASVLSLYIDAQ